MEILDYKLGGVGIGVVRSSGKVTWFWVLADTEIWGRNGIKEAHVVQGNDLLTSTRMRSLGSGSDMARQGK